MIKSILLGKYSGKSDWYVAGYWQWFYRIKALICAIVNREPSEDTNVFEHLHLTYTDGGTSWSDYGTVYWFEAIIVGHGVFSNWWVTYYQDSN